MKRRDFLGGAAAIPASEIQVRPSGAARNHPWARETGIIEELMLEDLATNHDRCNSRWDLILYEAVRREPGITVFFNTSVREAAVESAAGGQKRITSLRAVQLATEKELVFTAAQYADCTGDATVGFLAGAGFRYGAEPRSEYDEPLAPLKGGDVSLGSTIGPAVRGGQRDQRRRLVPIPLRTAPVDRPRLRRGPPVRHGVGILRHRSEPPAQPESPILESARLRPPLAALRDGRRKPDPVVRGTG